MPSNSAEYQRAYRAKRRARTIAALERNADLDAAMVDEGTGHRRIAELEEEVRHLKRELATRLLEDGVAAANAQDEPNPIALAWSRSKPVPKTRK